MAYDEGLVERLREAFREQPAITEKKMFGGVGFLCRGNMCCGVSKDSLVVRVGPQAYAEAVKRPHASAFGPAGRAMTGWVMIAPKGYESDAALSRWVKAGLGFASSLPAK